MSIVRLLSLPCLAALLSVAACSVEAASDDATSSDESEIRQSTVVGTWRFESRPANAGSLSGLELRPDGTYVGEVMQACSDGEPGEASGCRGVPIRGTWEFAPFITELSPWATLTLHGAATRYEQPGNKPKPMDLVLSLTQKLGSDRIVFEEKGDHAPLAFAFGSASVRATLAKDAATPGFCATSDDCAGADLFHPMLVCNGEYAKTCNADRKCGFPCLAADEAGYGDACGLLPGGDVRVRCHAPAGAKNGIRCLDNMAGGYGKCVATGPGPKGPTCGNTQCAADQVCCNALSGICTAPGELCAQ